LLSIGNPVGESRNSCRVFVGKLEGKSDMDDLVVDGRITL
jgi:hypothetical protein